MNTTTTINNYSNQLKTLFPNYDFNLIFKINSPQDQIKLFKEIVTDLKECFPKFENTAIMDLQDYFLLIKKIN
jgi:hypothetical protein